MTEIVATGRRIDPGRSKWALAPPMHAVPTCLFLDVDGTLVDFAPTPGEVRIDPELIELLGGLTLTLDGALALISGRPIADLDRLFDPLLLPAAGIHGLERRDLTGTMCRNTRHVEALAPVRKRLQALIACRSGLILEDKQAALAVHFRRVPEEEDWIGRALEELMSSLAPDFQLLKGDKVLEIKPSSHSKSSAVEAFMSEAPFAGRRPLYFGDDYTDRDGFAAVERSGGMAVAVGNKIASRWKLPDSAAVRDWLALFAGAQSA